VDHAANPATVYKINTGVTDPVNFGMPEIAVDGFNPLGGNHGWPLLTTPNQTYQGVGGGTIFPTRAESTLSGLAENSVTGVLTILVTATGKVVSGLPAAS